jgi:Rieske Fe-S protein
MDRRDFVLLLVAGPAAAQAAGCATVRSAPFSVEGERVAVALDALDAGGMAVLAGPPLAEPVLVRRTADGTYDALSLRCTHRGCTVAPAGDRLACPCHGSEFAFSGEVLQGPAAAPLRRGAVTADGDRLLVTPPPPPG